MTLLLEVNLDEKTEVHVGLARKARAIYGIAQKKASI